jgi:hypothetical protein
VLANTQERVHAQQIRNFTPQGRERSARNSLKHGLSAEVVVLPHEDQSQFESFRDSYFKSFQPADRRQADLVETMADSRLPPGQYYGPLQRPGP